ncbi:PH domain-containing protein [Streptomyces sp. 549]|uniref:PH domain-containing protein n=1 Tax=Streptomyces sp. 549 TaxID=3049076 RepID=UPI0024C26109|nr:PH domain-containing protein [Streptomyces sp. 549]MDK1473330.1 PH domain-containing protein [Streptomyces sp. 549]
MPPAAPRPSLPLTFRPTRTRVVLLAVGAAIWAVLAVIALLLEGIGVGERITFIFTGGLFFAVLALLARPHVTAEEGGVTVVNLTTRRRLDWPEILQVNLRSGDPWVLLDLSDGTSLPAMGIQPGVNKRQAIEDAETLRALAEHYGGSRPTSV